MRGRGAALLTYHCSGQIWRSTKIFLTVLSTVVDLSTVHYVQLPTQGFETSTSLWEKIAIAYLLPK